MRRKLLCLFLAGLLIPAPRLDAQAGPDPDVAKGIALVDEGDYDMAILILDNTARRLAPDKSRTKELSQVYLYLGIAYMGKGHEAAARAKFREAIAQIKDLTLSPDSYPPKVIDAFEAAKEEVRKESSSSTAPAVAAAPPPSPKKGGSGKLILIVGGVAAAAGIAAAAGGGGGGAASPSRPATPTRRTETFTGFLGSSTEQGEYKEYRIVPTTAGTLDATLTWSNRDLVMSMGLRAEATGNVDVAMSTAASNTQARLTASVTNQTYFVTAHVPSGSGPIAEPYTLVVQYP